MDAWYICCKHISIAAHYYSWQNSFVNWHSLSSRCCTNTLPRGGAKMIRIEGPTVAAKIRLDDSPDSGEAGALVGDFSGSRKPSYCELLL